MSEISNVISLNVRGLRNGVKRRGLFHWLKKYHNADTAFIMLQETHSTVETENLWKQEYGSDIFFSHGTSSSGGTAILIPPKNNANVKSVESLKSGRCIAIEIEIENECEGNLALINVYAPTQDHRREQMSFINELGTLAEKFMNCTLILGGDLNICLDPVLDKYGTPDGHSEYRSAIKVLSDHLNIADIWRILNPDVRRYTWRQCNPLRQSRLDYMLTSVHLMYNIRNIEILPSFKSDHSLVKLHLHTSEKGSRGPGFWKFNNTLLRDIVYLEYINGWIEQYKEIYSETENKSTLWDVIKCEIRRATLAYSKTQARLKKQALTELTSEFCHLEARMCETPSDSIIEKYQVCRSKLEKLHAESAAGVQIRTRATEIEYGEKNSKYFSSLEKTKYKIKHITNLEVDGKEITEPKSILMEEKLFL